VGNGADDAIIPLIATAVVIGFGSVVTKTSGFMELSQWLLGLEFNPLLSIFISVSLMSAIVGSSAGGLQIFLSSMSDSYIAKGVEPEMLHRIATMASGGFDSLPHCGAVVAVLAIAGLTHKEGYKDLGVVTVIIPVFATLITIAVYSI
jgi:H+/gluconate symporter-like permease